MLGQRAGQRAACSGRAARNSVAAQQKEGEGQWHGEGEGPGEGAPTHLSSASISRKRRFILTCRRDCFSAGRPARSTLPEPAAARAAAGGGHVLWSSAQQWTEAAAPALHVACWPGPPPQYRCPRWKQELHSPPASASAMATSPSPSLAGLAAAAPPSLPSPLASSASWLPPTAASSEAPPASPDCCSPAGLPAASSSSSSAVHEN